MMTFTKYHGTGNDFILIDDRITKLNISPENIKKLCNRHFGIGADGMILIRNKMGYDFEMLYYNSDGLPGSMCGNGGRCSVAFAHTLGIIKDKTVFVAFDGVHEAVIISAEPYVVKLHMNDVREIEKGTDFYFLDTGSPHYITFRSDLDSLNVLAEGRTIRYNKRFNVEGTNVNFVVIKNNELLIRTYERGVEDETLSCGTGVTASVLAASIHSNTISSGCKVHTPGGILNVHFKKSGNGFTDIWLEGEATKVFEGQIKIGN
jgi:diaminopimelate epimerase